MIDTHAHLFDDIFDSDIDQILSNAKEVGVESIIMPAIEPSSFNKMINLAESYKFLFCSIGIHPHNAKEVNDQNLALLETLAMHDKVKAIGEIGLDYYYDFAPKEVQINAFTKQIELAKKFRLPIIVHNRESDSDLIKVLSELQDGNLNGVLHCFSGDIHMLKKSLDLGFYISFTGNITFKKADELRKVVAETPLERILLETDSPWMAPVPLRGKRNEPKYVRLIAEKIAEIKQVKIEEVINMTTKSAKSLFKLGILILFLMSILVPKNLMAQDDDDNNVEDTLNLVSDHPYYKLIGIAPILGTNTVVNTFAPNDEDRSQDGLLTYGVGLFSSPVEWMFIEMAFLHYEDKKPNEETKNIPGQEPLDIEQHNMFEIGGGIVLNPAGKVNFYGFVGYSFETTESSKYISTNSFDFIKRKYSFSRNGINTGIGFFANIPFEKAGNFVLNAEWRLNFILKNTILDYDPRVPYTDPNYNKSTEYSSFFSIPRVSVIWYPPLDEWFGSRKN
jgi:TatD DNase family protein